MVQIGTIEYEAKVTGVAEAKQNANDLADSQEEVASSSRNAAASGSFLAGVLGTVSSQEEEAGEEADRTSTKTKILSSSLFFLGSTAVGTAGELLGLQGALGLARAGAGRLVGALSGLTLSGVVGSVTSAVSGFVSWLAAGSAGALALAGAIGFALGVLGVWILQVTGALDAVRGFGQYVGNVLPASVRDGLLMMISVAAGPLAAFGAFITGTLEGGFDEGFRRAREVLNIFVGVWERSFDRAGRVIGDLRSRVTTEFGNIKSDVQGFVGDIGDTAGDIVKAGFNAAVPSNVNIPSVTLSAPDWAGGMSKTIGGGSINLPQLQVGGMVEQTGAAVVHKGESVIPEPLVNAAQGGGGGGGGDTTQIGTIEVHISGEFDPSNLSRRDLDRLASKIDDAIGKRTNTRAGVR